MNKQLRKIRQEKKMTIEKLSLLSGIGTNTISGFEMDRYNTGYKIVSDLAHTLGYEFVLRPIVKEKKDESNTSELYIGC